MKLEFSQQIFEKGTQISNFMKIRPVEAEFLADGRTHRQAGRQTGMTKPPVAFRGSARAPADTSVLRNRRSHKFRYSDVSQK